MESIPRVSAVRALGGHRIWLKFEDGSEGEIDFATEATAWSGVLSELRDPDFFARVSVDEELATLIWPNGVDFAPEALHDDLAAQAGRRKD